MWFSFPILNSQCDHSLSDDWCGNNMNLWWKSDFFSLKVFNFNSCLKTCRSAMSTFSSAGGPPSGSYSNNFQRSHNQRATTTSDKGSLAAGSDFTRASFHQYPTAAAASSGPKASKAAAAAEMSHHGGRNQPQRMSLRVATSSSNPNPSLIGSNNKSSRVNYHTVKILLHQ